MVGATVKWLSICLCVVILISPFGFLNPFVDIFSHFRWQMTCLSLISATALFVLKMRRTAMFLSILVCFNALSLAYFWLPMSTKSSLNSASQLTLLNMNLNYGNTNWTAIESEIRKNNPDVITFEELTPTAFAHLKGALRDYPYESCLPRMDSYGIGLFSKYKLAYVEPNPLRLPVSLVTQCDIQLDDGIVTIMAIHACDPTTTVGFQLDKMIAEGLTGFIDAEHHKSIILIGDMNSAPWSCVFGRLLHSGPFTDSERGFGV